MPTADLVITGRVATLAGDHGFGWRAGIAIADGRVLAVGRESELAGLLGPATQRWRLADDQLVVPGITDAHLHLMTLVLAHNAIDMTGLGRPAALLAIRARHEALVAQGNRDGWLQGHGWSMHDLGGWPDAQMLEDVAPGRPMAMFAHDHHALWLSVVALRAASITSASPNPEGGLVRRDDAGNPTGILHEAASILVEAAIPAPTLAEIEAALTDVARELAGLGVTGCHDPGILTGDAGIDRGPLFYRRLAGEGRLPLRVHASVRAPQLSTAINAGLRSGQQTGRYTMGWLKLFADGSLGSRSAAMLAPYTDAATNPPTGGPNGMYITQPTDLADLARRAESNGIAVQIHAIGDAAVRAVLDVFESLPPVPHGLHLMRRVEHAQLIDPHDQQRFGRLGVAASVQPVHLRSDEPQIRAGWGDRGDNAIPLRALLDGGALIPFGTDAPVEPPDPWPGLAEAVVRRNPSDQSAPQVGPRQAIDLARALRAATLDPALVAGQNDLGRLTVGSRADLLIVPAAGFAEPLDADALAATRPLATLIDGQVVQRDARFDP
ncbi:MAG: amidohydrolase [Chloroflexota bacterium]|nr:amidohydrolase [Chloroflexota bacterium]